MNVNESFIPTRQSLLSRLRDWGDNASWQDFYETYRRLIFGTALEAGLNATEAEEVVQETMISVSKAIGKFHYDRKQGSFKGWLRTTTIWRIRDHLRRQQRARTESLDALGAQGNSPGVQDPAEDPIARNWDLAWERNLAAAAIDRVKKKVNPQHFQIFDLAVIKDWPAARVAQSLHVSAAYVYLTKHRVSVQVRRELNRLRRQSCLVGDLPEAVNATWGEPSGRPLEGEHAPEPLQDQKK